jgi:hypothetical protein
MVTFRTFGILAALSLAGTAYAQTQTTPDQSNEQNYPSSQQTSPSAQQNYPSTERNATPATTPGQEDTGPAAASSRHQRDVTKKNAEEAPTNANPNPTGAASPHQEESTRMAEAGRMGTGGMVSSGMQVQSKSGESLGTVVDVVPSSAGRMGYVVVAGSGGSATPLPYSTASSMVQNGRIVVDKSKFQGAPKVQQSQMEDKTSTAWQKKADSYWGGQHGTTGRDQNMSSGSMRDEQMRDEQRSQMDNTTTTPRDQMGTTPR